MRRQPQLHLVDTVRSGPQLRSGDGQCRLLSSGRQDRADHHEQLGLAHRQPVELRSDGISQLSSSRGPGLGDSGGVPAQLGGQFVAPSCQRRDGLFGTVQAGQALASLVRPGQHTVDVRGVLAGQALEFSLSAQHLLQPGRVGVECVEVTAELGTDVAEHRRDLSQAFAQRPQVRIVHRLQPAAGLPDQTDGTRLVGIAARRAVHPAGQCRLRDRGGLPESFGIGQPASLGQQRSILSGLRVDCGDLRETLTEQVSFCGQLPGTVPAGGQLSAAAQPLLPNPAVSGQRPGYPVTSEAVQQGALLAGPQQPQLVVLAVHGQHALG